MEVTDSKSPEYDRVSSPVRKTTGDTHHSSNRRSLLRLNFVADNFSNGYISLTLGMVKSPVNPTGLLSTNRWSMVSAIPRRISQWNSTGS